VSVSKQSGTNLLLECIFSNLFGMQAKFFARFWGLLRGSGAVAFGGESSERMHTQRQKKLI
jgi:hypothetical protein